jgi:hypothetical protein
VRLFNDADCPRVAIRILAVGAKLTLADVVAQRAESEVVLHIQDRLSQPFGILSGSPEHVESQPLRGLLPDSRKPLKLLNQPGERFGEIGHT